jgi:alkylated DNA repair protein alkB family protein 8
MPPPSGTATGTFVVGCDFSIGLLEIVKDRGLECFAGDNLALPLRSASFDAALSIAVLHHISTEARRVTCVREVMRLVKPGGQALFYAWAFEQNLGKEAETEKTGGNSSNKGGKKGGVSGHKFAAQDNLVPFHKRASEGGTTTTAATDTRRQEPAHAVVDEAKGAVVYQRYCHVYVAGELVSLVKAADGGTGWLVVEESWYDSGNWCVRVRRTESTEAKLDALSNRGLSMDARLKAMEEQLNRFSKIIKC